MEWTIYVDLDAFYVSVELRDRPDLVGRPVLVGPDPTRGPTRGVVLSASYEARRFGARSALPVARAAALVPDAVWIPPDFEKYVAASRAVHDRLRTLAPRVVPLSIDEAALTWEAPDPPAVQARAEEIQRILDAEFHLSASLGVATHRVVAKIASDRQKPHGITVVPPDEVRSFLAPLPVRAIPGIGPKTGERLEAAGLRTIDDLRIAGRTGLRPILGGFADDILALARGTPRPLAEEESGPKLRSADRTFPEDVQDPAVLRAALGEMAPGVAASIASEGFRAGSVAVAVRWDDFSRSQHGRTLPHPVGESEAILRTAEGLLRDLWEVEQRGRARGVRTLSLRLERLRPVRGHQRRLEVDPGATAPP